MKKFKKPLTINIVQDTHETPSPQPESKQTSQYRTHVSDSYQPKHKLDDEQNQNKINVVQFEQFKIDGDNQDESNQVQQQVKDNNNASNGKKNKREFVIQIPQNNDDEIGNAIFQHQSNFKSKTSKTGSSKQELSRNFNSIKQPPAPSNRTKISKNNKFFVFPTNDQMLNDSKQTIVRSKIVELKTQKNNIHKKSQIFISEEEHLRKIQEIIKHWASKLQECSKAFQKERQQFYKQKSNMQKDLMIKNGQIDMLQKLITDRYSPKAESRYQQKNQFYNQQSPKNYEALILQKDLQANDLLQRINQLNRNIQAKSLQLDTVKINNLKLQSANQSLRNQLYVYQRKEMSDKITRQFYVMKQKQKTPKDVTRRKWEEEIINNQRQKQIQIQKQKEKQLKNERGEFGLRGIDDLHKRLQSLKMNRMELQGRGKIKSQIGYPQTSKNKAKGAFDFKGKYYDRQRDILNQTRMF